MRTILTMLMIGLAFTTLAALGADNTIGTWKLNIEQSQFNLGAMPGKSLTVLREASDGGVKVTITGEAPDGTAINASYTAKYDGQAVQVSGNAPYDTIAIKQVNASTLTDERKKVGTPYHATGEPWYRATVKR
jgi:hypothetical protein